MEDFASEKAKGVESYNQFEEKDKSFDRSVDEPKITVK